MPSIKYCNRLSQILPVLSVVTLGLILQVRGFSSGAASSSCDTMRPNHHATANKTAPPYVIRLSSTTYSPNQQISVTIESKAGNFFRGFILAARPPGKIENFGRFIPISGTKVMNCLNKIGSTITHSGAPDKINLTFIWEAPDTNVGDLQINATIVMTAPVYWLNVTSDVLQPSFQTNTAVSSPSSPSTTTPPPETNEINCKSSMNCQIQWRMDRNAGVTHFNFSLESLNVNMYISLGLSSDRKMGDDSVMECLRYPNGSTLAQLSYNAGTTNTLVASESITLTSASFENGWMRCSFTRKNTVNNSKIFNFEGNEWFLLVAIGKVDTNEPRQKAYHSLKFSTDAKINLAKSEGVLGVANSGSGILISIHGSLMIFAWTFFASVGMFTARYSKTISTKIKGVALWFQLHRMSMVLTLLLTLIGFILVFVGKGRYSASVGLPYDAHPVLGIIVTILTVTNPVMAYFRPGKDSSNRILFNWAHRSVGVTAFILADAAIFIGIVWFHNSGNKTTSTIAVLIFFLIYKFVAIVTMELLECCKERTVEPIELKTSGEIKPTEERKDNFDFIKSILLTCHTIITFILSVLLIIFLNIGI